MSHTRCNLLLQLHTSQKQIRSEQHVCIPKLLTTRKWQEASHHVDNRCKYLGMQKTLTTTTLLTTAFETKDFNEMNVTDGKL